MDVPDSSPVDYFICGGFGGICSTIAGYPFDTIKVRLQTMEFGEILQRKGRYYSVYREMLGVFKQTIANEGIFGLYKGMLVPILTVPPIFGVSFMSYRIGKQIFGNNAPNMSYTEKFCAGAFSGFVTTFITCPMERIKCTMQVHKDKGTYKGALQILTNKYNTGGIRNVFRGYFVTICREVPFSGVYFIAFEVLTQCKSLGLKETVNDITFGIIIPALVLFGIALPFDVLKSRLQTSHYPGGIRQVYRELVSKEGHRALYKGALPMFIRILPAYAACFYGFFVCQYSCILPIKKLIKERQEYGQFRGASICIHDFISFYYFNALFARKYLKHLSTNIL